MVTRKILGAMAAIAMMAWGTSANAVTCTAVSTSTNPDATLTHSTGCGAGIDGNDEAADIGTVLGGTWFQLDRDNDGAESGAGTLRSTGNGAPSGSWGFNDAGYLNYVLVIKDGKPSGDPDVRWFWFRVDLAAGCTFGALSGQFNYCGNWTMYDNKNISHLTLYGSNRRPPDQVPEPGTLALLGLGLLGLGAARSRKA